MTVPSLQAQTPSASATTIAADADVLGAERLFSAWMEGQIAYRGLPGIAVGVVHDQQLVWATGYGFADLKNKIPMTPQTRFRMASHSKMFAAIAIMQLREEGKLRLDDPVQKDLPWFAAKPAGDDDGVITVEQLLSHVSGLQREAGDHWSTSDFPTEGQLKALYSSRQAAFCFKSSRNASLYNGLWSPLHSAMALGFTWDAAKSAANVRKHGVSFEDASTPPAMSGRPMKKISKAKRTSDGMRVEYDFSGGVRGKYAARYRAGTNVVMLDPDVAATFKDAEAVNRALRAIIAVVPIARRRPRRARSA